MGDMREAFQMLNEINKERRAKNFARFHELQPGMATILPDWIERNDYHFTFSIKGQKGQYWPSSSKWQLGNKIFHGKADDFLRWAKKRLA